MTEGTGRFGEGFVGYRGVMVEWGGLVGGWVAGAWVFFDLMGMSM